MRGLRIIPYPEWEYLGQRGSGLSLNLSRNTSDNEGQVYPLTWGGGDRMKEYLIEKRHQVYPLTWEGD